VHIRRGETFRKRLGRVVVLSGVSVVLGYGDWAVRTLAATLTAHDPDTTDGDCLRRRLLAWPDRRRRGTLRMSQHTTVRRDEQLRSGNSRRSRFVSKAESGGAKTPRNTLFQNGVGGASRSRLLMQHYWCLVKVSRHSSSDSSMSRAAEAARRRCSNSSFCVALS